MRDNDLRNPEKTPTADIVEVEIEMDGEQFAVIGYNSPEFEITEIWWKQMEVTNIVGDDNMERLAKLVSNKIN